jgi:4-amino-4-deoxy-L-arabinose transferase-like glycosyltransferase
MSLFERLKRIPPGWLALAVIFPLALALRYPVADIPLERDEGGYAYVAQWWLRGDVPYKDSIDLKPPGLYFAYLLLLVTAGSSPAAIHWGAQAYTLGTIAVVLLLGWKLFTLQDGILAAALTAFLTTAPAFLGNAVNSEILMLLPLVAGWWAALHAAERGSARWGFLAGAFGAAAVLMKHLLVLNLLFYLVLVLWAGTRRWQVATGFVLGVLGMVLPFGAYFYATDAWDDLVYATIGFNVAYGTRLPLFSYPNRFWIALHEMLRTLWPICSLAVLGLAATDGVRSRATQFPLVVVVGWLFCSFLVISAGGYYRAHYFIQLIPAVALLAARGISQLVRLPLRKPLQDPYAVCALVIVYGVLSAPWYYLGGTAQAKCRALYGSNPFPESAVVAAFIAERSEPDDTVFILGSEPQILFYADRKSATRFIFTYPLVLPHPRARNLQLSVLEDLRRSEPRFIVTVLVSDSFAAGRGAPVELFNGVQKLLEDCYSLAGTVPLAPETTFRRAAAGTPKSDFQRLTAQCSLAVWERSSH